MLGKNSSIDSKNPQLDGDRALQTLLNQNPKHSAQVYHFEEAITLQLKTSPRYGKTTNLEKAPESKHGSLKIIEFVHRHPSSRTREKLLVSIFPVVAASFPSCLAKTKAQKLFLSFRHASTHCLILWSCRIYKNRNKKTLAPHQAKPLKTSIPF